MSAGVRVEAIVGKNGAGKTALAVLAGLAHDGPVLSNITQVGGGPVEGWGHLKTLDDLVQARDSLIILDEVTTAFASRGTSAYGILEVSTFLHTLRHRRNRFLYTASSFARAELALRELTTAVTVVAPAIRKGTGPDGWRRTVAAWTWRMAPSNGEIPTKAGLFNRRLRTITKAYEHYDTLAETPNIVPAFPTVCGSCGGALGAIHHSPATHYYLGVPWIPEIHDQSWRRL